MNRIPVRVAAVSVAMLMALLCWAFASPVASSPDDDFHIANVYCLHDAASCPPEDQPRILPCFVRNNTSWYAPDAAVPADCLSSEDQGSNQPQTPDDITYYPSGYYRLLSVFTQDSIRESVAAWRVVVAVLTLSMAVASVGLSLPAWRRPLTVAWMVSSVPLGMFLLSSHNPSAVTIIGAAAIVGPGVALLDHRSNTSKTVLRLLLIGLSLLLMVGGRTEGLLFVAVTVVLVLLLGIRCLSIRTATLGALVVFALALVSWLALPSLSTKVTLALGLDAGDGAARQTFWDGLALSAEILTGSYDSPLGWLEINMPTLVTVAAGAAFWGTIMLGLAAINCRKALAIAVVVATLLGISIGAFVAAGFVGQVRYHLPLIYLLVIAALAPIGRRALPTWGRAQWWALCMSLVVANSVALLYSTVRYVTGISPGTASPGALAAAQTPDWWWGAWLGPFSNWLVGSLTFAATLALLPSLLMRLERDETDGSPHPSRSLDQYVDHGIDPEASPNRGQPEPTDAQSGPTDQGVPSRTRLGLS